MMLHWVLIIMLHGNTGITTPVPLAEYLTQADCNKAKDFEEKLMTKYNPVYCIAIPGEGRIRRY